MSEHIMEMQLMKFIEIIFKFSNKSVVNSTSLKKNLVIN